MNKELSDAIKAILGTYPQVRDKYREDVFVAVYEYLDSDKPVTTYRNAFKRAMTEAFFQAAEIGWENGGGTLPFSKELADWLAAMTNAELGHIDLLFQTLKELRKDGEVLKSEIALARAEGYAQTLDMVYNRAKLMAAGGVMLTFTGEDGKESCTDCRKYKNKRRKASWWVKNDAIPPNRGFECHGYNCNHRLVDDSGRVWTL